MKSKLLAIFTIVLLSGAFTACSEEVVEPTADKKDVAKGATDPEKNW